MRKSDAKVRRPEDQIIKPEAPVRVTLVNFGKIRASKKHATAIKQFLQLIGILLILTLIIGLIGVGQVVTCKHKRPKFTIMQCLKNEYGDMVYPTKN